MRKSNDGWLIQALMRATHSGLIVNVLNVSQLDTSLALDSDTEISRLCIPRHGRLRCRLIFRRKKIQLMMKISNFKINTCLVNGKRLNVGFCCNLGILQNKFLRRSQTCIFSMMNSENNFILPAGTE